MTAPITHLHDRRPQPTHPSTLRYSGTRKGLLIAAQLITTHDLSDPNVSVWDGGRLVVLDWTGHRHAAGHVRRACQALGVVCEELAAEQPDGTAAVELRGSDLHDGVLRTVRAVIAVPATWDSQ